MEQTWGSGALRAANSGRTREIDPSTLTLVSTLSMFE